MARRKRSISLPVTLASVTVALSIALLVGWILLIMRNWELTQVTQDVWLLVAGVISFVVIMTVLVLFVIFLAREILEVRRQDSFIDSVTHELKSPLASLLLMVQTLQRHNLDEARRGELLEMMADDIDRLSVFVDDVLVASRVAFGKTTHRLTEVNLEELIQQCIVRVSKRYKLDKDSVQATIPDGFTLNSDETLLEVILNNLLDNAVKYSPDGGPIRIRTESHPNDVWVVVNDEGIGIEPGMHEAIFDRFKQVEEGLRRDTGGLGIGLSLVKKLVDLHDGKIWMKSEPGQGSTFSFSLPLTTGQGKLPEANSSNQSLTDTPWSGLKILVVDDLEDYHQLMKMLMRAAGSISSAFNGKEAIEMIGKERPDLIIMDLRMPIMDGFEAIRLIRENPETKKIPILGISAQAMPEDQENCLAAGADGFVTKPVEYDTLRREILKILP